MGIEHTAFSIWQYTTVVFGKTGPNWDSLYFFFKEVLFVHEKYHRCLCKPLVLADAIENFQWFQESILGRMLKMVIYRTVAISWQFYGHWVGAKPLTLVRSSANTWSYSLMSVRNITALTCWKQCIHFLLKSNTRILYKAKAGKALVSTVRSNCSWRVTRRSDKVLLLFFSTKQIQVWRRPVLMVPLPKTSLHSDHCADVFQRFVLLL